MAPTASRRDTFDAVTQVQAILDDVERLSASRNNTLAYLGLCSPRLPALNSRRSVVSTLFARHHAEPCASLCTHAYGIDLDRAVGFFARVRAELTKERYYQSQPAHRYNIDMCLRTFYHRDGHMSRQPPLDNWPMCVDLQVHQFAQVSGRAYVMRQTLGGGLFVQNKSLPSQAAHATSAAGRLSWRR